MSLCLICRNSLFLHWSTFSLVRAIFIFNFTNCLNVNFNNTLSFLTGDFIYPIFFFFVEFTYLKYQIISYEYRCRAWNLFHLCQYCNYNKDKLDVGKYSIARKAHHNRTKKAWLAYLWWWWASLELVSQGSPTFIPRSEKFAKICLNKVLWNGISHNFCKILYACNIK